MLPERIYLCGFMGSGKTTVGRLLAETLGYTFIDTDEAIEQASGCSIAELFRDHGEAHFRLLERKQVEAAAKQDHAVVALGGGSLIDPVNWDRVSRSGSVVYLKADLSVLARRLARAGHRPLGARPDLDRLFETRRRNYEKASLTVDSMGLDAVSVADLIRRHLESAPSR